MGRLRRLSATEEISLSVARAVLSDPAARTFIAVIGYLVPAALTLTSLKPFELRLKLAGGVGQSYAVETSPDLSAWTTALKVTLTNAIVEVALPDNNESARFIRTRNN